MRALIAIALANLPLRWWKPFEERFPLHRMAWLSGLATMFAGIAIGIPAYLIFMGQAADGFNTAIGANPDLGIKSMGWGLASLPIFMFATPIGLLSTYLTLSGFLRAAAAFVADDVRGDLLLTGIDALFHRWWRDADEWNARKSREKQEGREQPDRLVTGEWLGRPDIELAIVASRRKDWPRGAYLVTEAGQAYRVGDTFDVTTKAGLRAVYPLIELKTGEAIRHAIAYELPPLWMRPRL